MTLQKILSEISILSILIPLLIGGLLYKTLERDSLVIFVIVALGTVPQLLRSFIESSFVLNLAYNLYTPLEFILFTLLFVNKFNNRNIKSVFIYTVIFYGILSLIIFLITDIAVRFINEWVCINNLIYTAWILMYLIEQYKYDEVQKINYNIPYLWYITAIFFYSPCTILIFSLWHYIKLKPSSLLQNLFIIHNIFNINMYILFTIGFIKDFLSKAKTAKIK